MQEVSELRLQLYFHPYPQYIVARKLGIHPSALSQYALGRKAIPARHLMALADYFGMEAESLISIVQTNAFEATDSG